LKMPVTQDSAAKRQDLNACGHELWLGKGGAPRCTSYPPVSSFHEGVTAHDYAVLISELPRDETVSLYIHIPFCRDLCLFCGCHTSVTHRNERITQYLAAMKREMKLLASVSGFRRRIGRILIGGGSPNIMTNRHLRELFESLNRYFDLDSCAGITVELDPRHVSADQVKTLVSCGVIGVNIGVQDFNPEVQKAVNRTQPFIMVEHVCRELRDAGIYSIGFDIIYGLPKQTPASMEATAEKVCRLAPKRIAFFPYVHTPLTMKHQKALEALRLPDKFRLLALESAAREVFCSFGYSPVGVDHFALPNDSLAAAVTEKRLRLDFRGYSDDSADVMLGLGSSAISRLPEGFFRNETEEYFYRENLQKGIFAVRSGAYTSKEDLLRRAIIEEFMCYMSCDIEALCKKHSYPAGGLVGEIEALKNFAKAGVITFNGTKASLAIPHRMAICAVARVFDRTAAVLPASASNAA